jgi:archaellum biogenesis protein FlaJ (TadC family)
MIIFSVFIIVNGTEMAFINLSVQISTRFFEIFFVVRVLNRLKTDMIIKFQSKKTKKEKNRVLFYTFEIYRLPLDGMIE